MGSPPDHYLSHVSNLWRDVVLVMISALFIQANWQQWPTWLVDAWRSRAQTRLLHTQGGASLFRRMDGASGSSCRVFLERFATQVRTLEIVYAMRASNEAL